MFQICKPSFSKHWLKHFDIWPSTVKYCLLSSEEGHSAVVLIHTLSNEPYTQVMTFLPHMCITFQREDFCWRLQFVFVKWISSVLKSLFYLVYFLPDQPAQSLRKGKKMGKNKNKSSSSIKKKNLNKQ